MHPSESRKKTRSRLISIATTPRIDYAECRGVNRPDAGARVAYPFTFDPKHLYAVDGALDEGVGAP